MGLTSAIYKKIDNITRTNRFLNKKYRDFLPHIELIKNKWITTINFIGQSQTRGQATARMLTDCLKNIETDKELHFRFFINDKPKEGYDKNGFYYCIDDNESRHQLIPDFSFDSWQEAGIIEFTDTVQQIEKKGSQPWLDSRLFWIGNVKTNKIRSKLLEIGKKHPEIFSFEDTYVDDFIIHKKNVPYLSIPDHTHYKYLLDVEGNSYSARLKFLFFSKRVVFIQDRVWKEFFHFELIPYEHYIPVHNDLSNLYQQYQFVESSPELYDKITSNALKFAKEHLTYAAAINLMTNTIKRRIDLL